MKTSLEATIVIDSEKHTNFGGSNELTLTKIQQAVNNGKISIEWVNSDLLNEPHPTLIIRL